ncbi:hypothetical protein PAESOLCIP111_04906 [Paenibacillus solanacearum]|uniref:SLH domain-containing protein n=1 Tax=Paenibacillus solanacearum TaxID=2048548 RepID=A0A916K5J7_9BACL|nr:S-layer homology domain-containing protein [Paenibacillus solanacearum]CAG7645217.1 hypothetical protein PAESOLCIP111_04906 [Paenibacillus solanacearum]
MWYIRWKTQISCLALWMIAALLMAPLFAGFGQVYAEGTAGPQASVTSGVYDQVTGAVYFPDAGLEAAVRETLGIPERYVTSDDLSQMTELVAGDRGIANLSGIEYAVNLQKLVLPHNQIRDISPLAGLSRLHELILFGNQIEQIDSLGQVASLEKLYLSNNRITDLEAVRHLTGLTELGLSHNQIRDISGLLTLQHLKRLELDHNEIANLSRLADLNLSQMEAMTLYDNPAQEMAPFLQQLEQRGVPISDTVMLAGAVRSDVTNVYESDILLNEFTARYGASRQSSPYGLYTVAAGYERNALRYWFEVPTGSYTIAAWNAGLSDSVTTDTYADSAAQLLYDNGALFRVKSQRDLSLQEPPWDSGDSDSSSDGGETTSAGELVQAALGGTVSVEGASVTIPRMAFPENILVKIEAYSDGSLPQHDRAVLASRVFQISKHVAGSFAKPITVTLAFDKSGLDLSKQELKLAWLDESADIWVALDNLAVNLQKDEISGTVTHLGKFAVWAVEKTLDDSPSQPSPPPPAYPVLSDIRGHWAEAQIRRFVERGALDGYPDGTFKPDAGITRAEFVTFLVKELGLKVGGDAGFADTAQHWARSYIAAAAQAGMVSGYSSTSFGPDDPVTREQIVLMLVNANVLKSVQAGQTLPFVDAGDISSWAREAVNTAVSEGVMDGYPDGTLRPQGATTRAEAVTLVSRVLQR